ncbi:MAG: DUF928 domain-containing protein [Mojavia pulchra JT2-VF2]|jgi:hypothetical protein|uniref:DUF928 domain-containing protein n=1 Tax=Mojavia pulchra JT2-VF2 TaxID=287848 RepID=A0A951Q7X3_9NOST|nr:DUF928 domain-containing protein [Mojavia pulchra JT2-VF2]
MKSYWQKVQLTTALRIALLGIITCYATIWMTPVSATPLKFSPPPPPPDRGAVGDRGGAASRSCSVGNQSVIALVPVYEQTLKQGQTEVVTVNKVWGLTVSEHPTFWFFLPYNKSQINTIEFVLKDESIKPSQTLYRTTVKAPEIPGIVSVGLPATTSPLQAGKMYHWYFKMKGICDSQQPVQREYQEYVEGWVQRVNPNPRLANSLKQATPQQRVGLYAENGIWYDALTTLAELRLAKPQDTTLATDWTNLLNSVGLEPFLK